MDRFHTIYSIGRKTSKQIFVVRWEINEKTAYIQARSFMARNLGEMRKNAKLKEKQKWSHEKPQLDQVTAAKIMDIISRLPGCDGQAADAVSAYSQVTMEDAHKLFKIQKSECPDIWIRLPKHEMAKIHGPVWKTQSFLLKGICTVHPLAGLLWERQFEKFLLQHGWEKVSKLGMLIRTPSKRVIFFCVCG